jgi:hypothetical protein
MRSSGSGETEEGPGIHAAREILATAGSRPSGRAQGGPGIGGCRSGTGAPRGLRPSDPHRHPGGPGTPASWRAAAGLSGRMAPPGVDTEAARRALHTLADKAGLPCAAPSPRTAESFLEAALESLANATRQAAMRRTSPCSASRGRSASAQACGSRGILAHPFTRVLSAFGSGAGQPGTGHRSRNPRPSASRDTGPSPPDMWVNRPASESLRSARSPARRLMVAQTQTLSMIDRADHRGVGGSPIGGLNRGTQAASPEKLIELAVGQAAEQPRTPGSDILPLRLLAGEVERLRRNRLAAKRPGGDGCPAPALSEPDCLGDRGRNSRQAG